MSHIFDEISNRVWRILSPNEEIDEDLDDIENYSDNSQDGPENGQKAGGLQHG